MAGAQEGAIEVARAARCHVDEDRFVWLFRRSPPCTNYV